MVADELNPLFALLAQVSVDERDDAAGIRSAVDEVTDLDDGEVVGQDPGVRVGAEPDEFVAQRREVAAHVADHCNSHADPEPDHSSALT